MNIVDNLLCHVDRIVDMLNVPGVIGCAYCFLRWPRCVRGKGRLFAILFVVPIAYFLVVSGMSLSGGTAISERYYQPVFPLLIVVSATGLYQLLKDTREWPFMGLFVVIVVIIGMSELGGSVIPESCYHPVLPWLLVVLSVILYFSLKNMRKELFMGLILFMLVGGNLVDMLDKPVRAHRIHEKRAGQWLKRYDPDYDGFVFSDDSQPVYYAGMEYLPVFSARWTAPRMSSDLREVKYAIMQKEIIDLDNGSGKGEATREVSLPDILVESGTAKVNHRWRAIQFQEEFSDSPVVVTSAPSFHGRQPGALRLRNVSTSGFEVCFLECAHFDGGHTWEDVRWLAIERGQQTIDGNLVLAADLIEIDADELNSAQRVEFGRQFEERPIVFTSIQAFDKKSLVLSRLCSIDKEGFSIFLQQEEGASGGDGTAVVGYLAIDPAVSRFGNVRCQAGWFEANLGKGRLIEIGDVQVGLRFQLGKQADQRFDCEEERIGLMRVGSDPHILAEMQTCRETDFTTFRLLGSGVTWMERYVQKNSWTVIYHDPERNVYIYRNPAYAEWVEDRGQR